MKYCRRHEQNVIAANICIRDIDVSTAIQTDRQSNLHCSRSRLVEESIIDMPIEAIELPAD